MKHKLLLILFLFSVHFSIAQNWKQWRNGLASWMSAVFVDTSTNELYAGGKFISSTGDTIFGVATLNSNSWDSLGNTDNSLNLIRTIHIYKDTLYMGGDFITPAGNFILWFGGSDWQNISNPANSNITDMCIFNNQLWIAGSFTQLGSIYPNHIAYYDGTWHRIAEPDWWPEDGRFHFQIFQGDLYVAGDWACDILDCGIIRWNGGGWDTLGIQFTGGGGHGHLIDATAVYNNELYIAGSFLTYHDSTPSDYIARWDGNQWRAVGLSPNGPIDDIKVYHNELYAWGGYTQIGGIPCPYGIAKWDGTKWCCLSEDSLGGYLYVYNDSLIISANFHRLINGDSINYVAVWTGGNHVDTCSSPVGISEYELMLSEFTFYPNPSSTSITINYPYNASFKYAISITDVFGKNIKEEKLPANAMKKEIDISGLANGVYFVSLESEKGRVTRKLVKQ